MKHHHVSNNTLLWLVVHRSFPADVKHRHVEVCLKFRLEIKARLHLDLVKVPHLWCWGATVTNFCHRLSRLSIPPSQSSRYYPLLNIIQMHAVALFVVQPSTISIKTQFLTLVHCHARGRGVVDQLQWYLTATAPTGGDFGCNHRKKRGGELLKFKRGFWHNDFRDVNLDVWNIVNQSKNTKAVNLVDNSQRG